MPTGVTVSRRGRVFVNFPRWGDDVPFTVAELRGGKPVAYPDAEVNRQDASDLAGHFQSVQSVVVDPADRLWILDTGSPGFAGSSYGGPKLVAVDLRTDRIVRKILFPPEVVPANSYPNDVRFDLRRGAEGMAFITDSGGSNGIIVVDLATGRSWRRLTGHPRHSRTSSSFRSSRASPSWSARGRRAHVLRDRLRRHRSQRRRHAPLLLPALQPSTAQRVHRRPRRPGRHGRRGGGDGRGPRVQADGRRSGERRQGRLYGGDLEHNAIWRRSPDGTYRTLVQGSDLIWVDTLSIASDRHLYATANQLDRLSPFHEGQDLRRKPYLLVRLPIDAGPVRLV